MLEALGVRPPATHHGVDVEPMHGASLRAGSSRRPDELRSTQYFEMFGHRGSTTTGGKAVVYHEPGTSPDDDVWELYRTSTATSRRSTTSAAVEPGAVANDLIARWWAEAERYELAPSVHDRAVWQLVRPPLRGAPTARRRFVYRPPISHLPIETPPTARSAPLHDRRRGGRADVAPGVGTDGALLSRGTINVGGYGRRSWPTAGWCSTSTASITTRGVVSPAPLAPGRRLLGVRGPRHRRRFRACCSCCLVDGMAVADADVGPLMRTLSSLGMDVGRVGAPVVDDHVAPFCYPGTIHEVVFEIIDPLDQSEVARLTASLQ